MSIYSKTGIAVCIVGLVLGGCGHKPSQPDTVGSLKQGYINLTNSLMSQVEQFRGKSFKRNIAVAVYTKDQYRSLIADRINALTEDNKKTWNAIWARENLLRPGMDYFAGYDTVMSSITGGYYGSGSDSINIVIEDNATSISYWDSVSIFHELVHAMQDQYFDLTSLQHNVSSTDQSNALRYVVEGEAELFTMYYSYKLYYGNFPSSSTPIVDAFNSIQVDADHELDSLHLAGEPMLRRLPFMWAYYSYGPLFISAVSQGNWQVIDNRIFASLPIKTSEVMYPSKYTVNRKEYLLDMGTFMNSLDSTQVIMDFDELGDVVSCVMFREWDFSDFRQIAQGLAADNIVVYRGTQDDSLRLIWYTKWSDAAGASAFMSAYTRLVNKKRNIILPGEVTVGTRNIVNDTINRVYLEQTDSTVIVMEDYPAQYFNGWLDRLHTTKSYLRSATLARRSEDQKKYPRVDKNILVRDINKKRFDF